MAALFQTSNVPGILQIDCVATEAFAPPAHPTYLFYNPYSSATEVTLNVGATTNHLYDAVAGVFLAANVTGNANFTIPTDSAVVLVQCPSGGAISQAGQKLLLGGIVIDYWNSTLDSDGDGLPNWWESRFYGNATNAAPQGRAANGFSNLQCYLLGLDPTNPLSTFRAQASVQAGTVSSPPVFCRRGEYANNLAASGSGFAGADNDRTNLPRGSRHRNVRGRYSLTEVRPKRFYRVRLVNP
jgi:hypothetical protein